MAICKKCKTVLVKCPDCYGSGKSSSGSKCVRCKGIGMLCQIHEGNHGN